MKAQSQNQLISAILMTALGVLLLVLKAELIGIAMTVFGVFMIVQAVLDIVHQAYVPATIKAVIGVAVILLGWLLFDIAMLVLAIVLLIYGVMQVIETYQGLSGTSNLAGKVIAFIQPVLYVVIAAFLLLDWGGVANWAFIIAGIVLIVQGVLALVECLVTAKK